MSAPDTRTEAEKLREAVAREIEGLFLRDKIPCGPEDAAEFVLRAVVETLRLTWAMADDLDFTDGFEDVGHALATLLTAAEVPND